MSYADELLELAREIATLHPQESNQASLRRAVSTAYYALFHLLVSEAAANWARPELRGALGRVFDHGAMRQAADKKVSELNKYFKRRPPEGPERTVAYHLYNVADIFAEAQYYRTEADYNTTRHWTFTAVILQIDTIAAAFNSWRIIREEAVAQAYLLSMLPSKERVQSDRPRLKQRPTLRDDLTSH
jgi:uncharacterized protein (UPF0332 family)